MATEKWSVYECLLCHQTHEMPGSPAQIRRAMLTKCPTCFREMRFIGVQIHQASATTGKGGR